MKQLIALCAMACSLGQAATAKKHNFLWVIDNSPSLAETREEISKAFNEMARQLKDAGVDYRMAVTTTDQFKQNGQLIKVAGVSSVESDSPAPEKDFQTLVLGIEDSPTSFWEQGLEASYTAITKEAGYLLEKGVPFSVVYVSDENDYSCKDKCFGKEPENNPDWVKHPVSRYTDLFHSIEKDKGIPVSIYGIVSTDDSPCQLPSLGERYIEVQADLKAGFTASVCKSVVRDNILKIAKDVIAQ